ncbi:MAG: hypothetical protein LBR84_10790 [Tannerella sp.]|jgi:hypothetical protein|nr:hypothetical protein [Tannerella sp.]
MREYLFNGVTDLPMVVVAIMEEEIRQSRIKKTDCLDPSCNDGSETGDTTDEPYGHTVR